LSFWLDLKGRGFSRALSKWRIGSNAIALLAPADSVAQTINLRLS
jgi:hypothetical protein